MKKLFSILFIFIILSLLIFCNLYAGSIIDKSQEGYVLLIPKDAKSGVKCPVLVCLPGYGVPAMKDINVWAYPADKMGFLVINFDVKYDTIKSNWDVQVLYERIERTIDHLSKIYPIDTEKVFIAGTSAGGMMSIALALKYPQRFLAIGVVCGA